MFKSHYEVTRGYRRGGHEYSIMIYRYGSFVCVCRWRYYHGESPIKSGHVEDYMDKYVRKRANQCSRNTTGSAHIERHISVRSSSKRGRTTPNT